ncbi:hypothetical protein [Chromobacterium violaceum]|uniref:HEXXH motif domain n=1 Tax=Chromobacterium violaceum TaxID=536 RepID=A0A381KQT0_CHRVL|nr:hypothetical protein [Chromobacterium violaceum]ATP27545.1 hypothetical protein CRN81_03500 [Chromobacterium violaceum]ATP31460.1 hypothetical protein CR207_03515 [Chromobacterium violaceum]MCD0494945.1 hypothetical protein [Chromobacterium violaceum]OLZ87614.1 hypothetical protein BS642_00435 [Chromobacterium violaceum]STB69374.1 Uncharacterised protein [Chromobacterium violaceum]
MSATQLFYLLKWEAGTPPMVDDVLVAHLHKMRSWARELFWFASCNGLDHAWQARDVEPGERALLNPWVFHQLKEAVSGLNERACRAAIQAIAEAEGRDGAQRMLGESIEVDFDSDICRRMETGSSTMSLPAEAFSGEERERVMDKLQTALAMIDAAAPLAGRLIRNATRTIICRKHSLDILAAETDPNDIGELRILNPQLDRYTVVDLVDTLIHESLHNFFAMYELQHGSFVAYQQSARLRPVSPWSGNPIPYNAFTHAILIYFALFHFYLKLYPSGAEFDRSRVESLLAKCARGFRLENLDACLRECGASPSWLFDLYRVMSDDVRAAYA